jgi:alpha-beta hydrolase superfamily lysophospholipase
MSEKVYFEIAGASRYKRINCVIYYPDETPKAIVNIVHSVYEHSGVYGEFMKFLADNGYVSVCHDMSGHGRTAKEYFELGFFADNFGYNQIVEDTQKVLSSAREKVCLKFGVEQLPAYIYGHSTGSFAARVAVHQFPEEYSGLIISSTAGKDKLGRIKLWFSNQLIQLKGERGHSKLLKYITEHKLKGNVPFDWYSSDKDEIKAFSQDKMRTFNLSVSASFDLLYLKEQATKKEWYTSLDNTLPILILSGEEDRFSSFGKASNETKEKLLKAGNTSTEMITYKGARNQILKDVSKANVFADVVWFLNRYNQ